MLGRSTGTSNEWGLNVRSGGGNKTAQQKANFARNKQRAKDMARARLKSKYSRGITGKKSKTRTA